MLSAVREMPGTQERATQIRSLLELAVCGLEPMLYPEKGLFSYKLKSTPEGLFKEGFSQRYTVITLLGLHRAERVGLRPSFNVQSIFDGFIQDTSWIDSAGDWGLVFWLCALQAPAQLPTLMARAGLETLLDRYRDARARCTMEMSWILAGLAHARLADIPGPDLLPLASRVYRMIVQNQGAEGIFGHQAKAGSFTGRLRGRLGSFADQVYPIYALSKFAQAWRAEEPLREARTCADTMCRMQGPLGQWWWHYDSASGRAVGRYPVYSVHQDGMAPMALFALSEASGVDYDGPIYKGLEWIYGANELGFDMRDTARSMIWRSLYQNKPRTYASELLGLARLPTLSGGLQALYECRPYHLGWLLYGLTPRSS